MDRYKDLENYSKDLGLDFEFVKKIFSSMSETLTPEEKWERKMRKIRERPQLFKFALENKLKIPVNSGDDLTFDAKEEMLRLSAEMRANPKGIDLLKYFHGDHGFADRYQNIDYSRITDHLHPKDRDFLTRHGDYMTGERKNVLEKTVDADAFMEGFVEGFNKREKDANI